MSRRRPGLVAVGIGTLAIAIIAGSAFIVASSGTSTVGDENTHIENDCAKLNSAVNAMDAASIVDIFTAADIRPAGLAADGDLAFRGYSCLARSSPGSTHQPIEGLLVEYGYGPSADAVVLIWNDVMKMDEETRVEWMTSIYEQDNERRVTAISEADRTLLVSLDGPADSVTLVADRGQGTDALVSAMVSAMSTEREE